MKSKIKKKENGKSKKKMKINQSIYWFIKLKQNQVLQKGFKKFTNNQMHKNNNQIKFIKNCIIDKKLI